MGKQNACDVLFGKADVAWEGDFGCIWGQDYQHIHLASSLQVFLQPQVERLPEMVQCKDAFWEYCVLLIGFHVSFTVFIRSTFTEI